MELNFGTDNDHEFVASESLGGAGVISAEGEYHLLVLDVNFGRSLDEEQIYTDSPRIVIKFEALAGPQVEATTNISLFSAKGGDSEKAARMKMSKQLAFLVATGLISIEQVATNNIPTFDFDNDELRAKAREIVTGKQVCAKLVKSRDGRFMDLNYRDVFHVDDPRVVHYSKDEERLKDIEAAHRIKPDEFNKLIAGGGPKPKAKASQISDDQLSGF